LDEPFYEFGEVKMPFKPLVNGKSNNQIANYVFSTSLLQLDDA
jgi:hypothetical protein